MSEHIPDKVWCRVVAELLPGTIDLMVGDGTLRVPVDGIPSNLRMPNCEFFLTWSDTYDEYSAIRLPEDWPYPVARKESLAPLPDLPNGS
jgi:hypothetical protein